MIARATAEEGRLSRGNGAVELVSNEVYVDNEHGMGPGVYTEKVMHISKFLPRFLRRLVPSEHARIVEKSWACYPYRCRNLYYCGWLGDRPFLEIDSRYLADDRGGTENALGLGVDELQVRSVVKLDIASEDEVRMPADADVSARFRPALAPERGGLVPGEWTGPEVDAGRDGVPMMCCYKVCRLHIAQPRVEMAVQRMVRNSIIRYNRQAFVWMDSWLGRGLDDVPGGGASLEASRRVKAWAASGGMREGRSGLGSLVGETTTAIGIVIATELSADYAWMRAAASDPFC
jgi:hypothetical protein